jgi:molybdate transport repressor ModE-like protein
MENERAISPPCCVIIEMEKGAKLGYRRAVLLNEIKALGSLSLAARTTKIPLTHARDLVLRMNNEFSVPLVQFGGYSSKEDGVTLTDRGEEITQLYWRQFEPIWLDILEERSRHY